MEIPYQYEQENQKELRQMYINQVYGHIRYRYPARRIICGGCGKEFFTQITYKKYCCYNCLRIGSMKLKVAKALKQRENRVCPSCGKTFTPTRSDGKYCSNTCRQRVHREKVKEQAGGLDKICPDQKNS